MKKTIMVGMAAAALALAMMSCKKQACNCGTIVDDRASDYSVVIKNDCSGNQMRFTLTREEWLTAYVGSEYCITNVTNW